MDNTAKRIRLDTDTDTPQSLQETPIHRIRLASGPVLGPPLPPLTPVNNVTQLSQDFLPNDDDSVGDIDDAEVDSDDNGDANEFYYEPEEDELEHQHLRQVAEQAHVPPGSLYMLKDGTVQPELKLPEIPPEYEPPNEFPFEDIDNPGGWNDYIYYPKYSKDNQYTYHRLPAGTTPVPGSGPRRKHKGWWFHYVAWNGDDPSSTDAPRAPSAPATPPPLAPRRPTRQSQSQDPDRTSAATATVEEEEDIEDIPDFSRRFATTKNVFPEQRRGSLDAEKLRYHGLNKEKMEKLSALFFYELLLPCHIPEKMPDGFVDTRKNYYNYVASQSYTYHGQSYKGGYGHRPSGIFLEDVLTFDGILYLHGALGAKHCIKKRWDKSSAFFQADIAKSGMSWYRWCEVKRNMKLCDNAIEEAKRSSDNFNPSYKFDLIYECLIHNLKQFTKRACQDIVIDESTWPYYGFGPFVEYLVGKMVSRGGQTVLMSDADRLRPRGFIHRRKSYATSDKFKTKGMSEVFYLISKYVLPLIGNEKGKLWSYGPHLTVDNYFNGDEILDWMGENGLGMIGTIARNRLPKVYDDNGKRDGIASKYFHKESTAGNPRARHARYANPITLVKTVPAQCVFAPGTPLKMDSYEGEVVSYDNDSEKYKVHYPGVGTKEATHDELKRCLLIPESKAETLEVTKPYRRVHCSFQSTGPCNIGSVNSIPVSYGYVSPRERGKGSNKRKWGIEMNHSRELYLNSYGRIDQTDAMIARTDIKYTSHKYYHAAVNHAKALVIATAYDMYKECAEGNLDPEWKLPKKKVKSFNEFQQRLGKQLLRYRAHKGELMGDEELRGTKQASIDKRGKGIRVTPSPQPRHRERGRSQPWRSPFTGRLLNYCSLASVSRAQINKRLCMSLSDYERHVISKITSTERRCFMCGDLCYTRCGICKDKGGKCVPLCAKQTASQKKTCYLDYHNPDMFALGREDKNGIRSELKSEWSPPTLEQKKDNAAYIAFCMGIDKREDDDDSYGDPILRMDV